MTEDGMCLMSKAFQNKDVGSLDPRLPQRPKNGIGTKGKEICLKTNYFEVKINDWDLDIFHYDVQIKHRYQKEGSVYISKGRKIEIFEKFRRDNDSFFEEFKIAYDGEKSAVSVGRIPQISNGEPVKVAFNNSNYEVVIKLVRQRNLSEIYNYLKGKKSAPRDPPTDVYQLLEIMFRYTLAITYTQIGKNSFFFKDNFWESKPIGDMEASRGFFAALKPAAWKDGSLLLNIDIVHAAFYKEQPVIDFMIENSIIYNKRNLNKALSKEKRKALKEKLKGLKVRTTHRQIPYKVEDIMEIGADQQMTNGKNDEPESIQEYLEKRYGIKLQFPKMNVIRTTKDAYLPIELCEIYKGQRIDCNNIAATYKKDFLQFTARPPVERLRNITDVARKKEITKNELVTSLGLSFSDKPMTLKGRILPPPDIFMTPRKDVIKPDKGQWEWDARKKKFYESKNIERWAVLSYSNNSEEDIRKFVSEVIILGEKKGMKIAKPLDIIQKRKPRPDVDLPEIQETYGCTGTIQMIMVILHAKKEDSPYRMVKKIGDTQMNINTQVVLEKNVIKAKHSTIEHILFKMNGKMGGRNSVTNSEERRIVMDRPVMIMGADVNHPPKSDTSGIPSIAAVVGSLDMHATVYDVQVRPQKPRLEVIEKIKEMTLNLLHSFFQKWKKKPERILMFRDGVSNTQFLEVLSYELKEMRAACTQFENFCGTSSNQKAYEPAITFLVVQKEHHTRLFQDDERRNNKNVPAGTVVDTTVTDPKTNDFYLCSHEGNLGTSKPTHYCVLWDDTDFSADQLQCFTFEMCHVYARCSKSVSIPTPAYYAHWVARRGKDHIQDLFAPGCKKLKKNEVLDIIRMYMEKRNTMYFL